MLHPKKKYYKLPLECLMGLLQGKELHFTTQDLDGSMNELILLPPQGNVTMTREQFRDALREERYEAKMELLKGLEAMSKIKAIIKEEE